MHHDFSLDLRAARRKAGLSQADCGHLLGGSARIIRRLEDGQRAPTLTEICLLSLIFGCSFESYFSELMPNLREALSERLATLPLSKAAHAEPPLVYRRVRHSKDEPYDEETIHPRLSG